MAYIAEYIWIDGTEPSAKLRSKAQVLADNKEPGIWGFDGPSTNQASGDNSDVVLSPVLVTPDPIRGVRTNWFYAKPSLQTKRHLTLPTLGPKCAASAEK
ncbi:MAG: hypothetical protein Ct9H300mP19_08450 [Dehalococcoidia bacterium]|nr:MAG: hypothetical protein Ct9H300mP19_08450 [Dehalococcoidia bacterium]